MSLLVVYAISARVIKKRYATSPIIVNNSARLNTFTSQSWIFPYRLFFRMIRHPLDVIYNIKHRNKSSFLAATNIYLIFIGLTILTTIGPSYLFRNQTLEEFSLLRHVLIISVSIIFIVFSNYLIATLNDGEGWFKDVYIGFAYSLAPFMILAAPITLLSYGFTLFELFIYQFLWFIAISWTGIYVLVMLKEIHGYSVSGLLKNIFLTLFTASLLVLLSLITFLLLNQVWDYGISLIREVMSRV
jgi:hypothetical protein